MASASLKSGEVKAGLGSIICPNSSHWLEAGEPMIRGTNAAMTTRRSLQPTVLQYIYSLPAHLYYICCGGATLPSKIVLAVSTCSLGLSSMEMSVSSARLGICHNDKSLGSKTTMNRTEMKRRPRCAKRWAE